MLDHTRDLGRRLQRFAPDKLAGRQISVDGSDLAFVAASPTRASPGALPLHLGGETFAVNCQPALLGHLFLFIQRQAIRVIELECRRSRQQAIHSGFRFVDENFFGYLERGGIAGLFVLHHSRHALDALHHLGVTGPHQFGREAGELIQVRILLTDEAGISNSAAHDLPENIAAAFVRWQHPVVYQECRSPRVIRVDAERYVGFRVVSIGDAEQFGRAVDYGPDQICVVVRKLALHHRGDALQTHSRVDRRARQRGQDAIGRTLILHEDQVPDLDKAAAAVVRKMLSLASRFGGFGSEIVVDLRAGSARPRVAHLPEIVRFIQAKDTVFRNARDPLPKRFGVVVVAKDRNVQLIFG